MNHLKQVLKDKGISPVIGVILLVAVTVALVSLATVIVFDIGSDVSDTSDITLDVQETNDGLNVNVIRNENVESINVRNPDGSTETLDASVGITHDIIGDSGDYSIVAVLSDGSEEVIQTVSITGDSEEGETVSGTVEYNPPVEGVTVKSLDEAGEEIDSVVTNADGIYEVQEGDSYTVNDNEVNPDENGLINLNDVEGESVPSVLMDGEGSANNPYEIKTASDLQAMQEDLGAHYIVMNDIDASGTENWNDNKGFKPVGPDFSNSFTGLFDGQGYEVDGLTIDRTAENNVGLIGYNDDGTVKNIGFVNADITGNEFVGGLVGWSNEGTVSESYAEGSVTGEGSYVGGLVGYNDGTVGESYSTGSVTGDSRVGGLVGYNNGDVSESYSTGSVTGDSRVGGLVGGSNGEVSESYSTGSVTGEDERVGGLVGYNNGDVSESYSTGSVTGEGTRVGGLVGYNFEGTVSESYATGSVTGNSDVGGLVGFNEESTVSDSYWDTESSGIDESEGGTGLETDKMTGEDAEDNMSELFPPFETVTDEYPILQWQE